MKQHKSVERERYNSTKNKSKLNKGQLVLQQHQKEMSSLRKKHLAQRENLEKQRKKEFEIIEKRYVNVWNEMESKFKKDLLRLEKESHVKKMNIKESLLKKRIM